MKMYKRKTPQEEYKYTQLEERLKLLYDSSCHLYPLRRYSQHGDLPYYDYLVERIYQHTDYSPRFEPLKRRNDQQKIRDEIIVNVLNRLGLIATEATHFAFESDYFERAWRHMVTVYYSRAYSHLHMHVARIHFFKIDLEQCEYVAIDESGPNANSTDKLKITRVPAATSPPTIYDDYYLSFGLKQNDNVLTSAYLGYCNLRPLPSTTTMLSYVMPNFDSCVFKAFMKRNDYHYFQFLAYERKVHFHNIELSIRTFPFFAQDNMVTVCVHANLLMLSHYTSKFLRKVDLSISSILKDHAYDKEIGYPSSGLQLPQIKETLAKNSIAASYYDFAAKQYDLNDLLHVTLSTLDSKLPVTIGVLNHVVLCLGYRKAKNSNRYELLIYDDSGMLFSMLTPSSTHFIRYVDWGQLEKIIEDSFSSKKGTFFMCLKHERASLDYFDAKPIFIGADSRFALLPGRYKPSDYRIFLATSTKVKEFLSQAAFPAKIVENESDSNDVINARRNQYIVAKNIFANDMPHYLWCCEVDVTRTMKLSHPYYALYFLNPYSISNHISRQHYEVVNFLTPGDSPNICWDKCGKDTDKRRRTVSPIYSYTSLSDFCLP